MRKRISARMGFHVGMLCAWVSALAPIALASEQIKIQAGSPMRYVANTLDPQVGQAWVAAGFDDSTWAEGKYGVGYDLDGPSPFGAGDLIATAVPAFTKSVFTRAAFQVPDASAVLTLTLGADYDDGWAAWINGVEVYRSPELPGAGDIAWNATVSFHESSNGPVPDYAPVLDISGVGIPALTDGTNVLAVAVWNQGPILNAPSIVLVPQLKLDTGDPPPVCTSTPEFTSALRIAATAADDGQNQGLAGILLAPGAVNLTLGAAVGVTVKASPIDIEQPASGTLVFTDLGGEVCDVAMLFLTDQTMLCQADDVDVSLPDTIYTVGGVCDSGPFSPCTTDGECPGSCSDVCRGGGNGGLPCTDDQDCPDGYCSRRSVECSLNLAAASEPQLPPGFEQSPECRIMTVRIPPLDPVPAGSTNIELVKDGNFQSNLRVMLSVYDGAEYPDFQDITTEVESQCVVETGFSSTDTPGQSSTRDKGQGDIGGAPGGIPPPPGLLPELPAQFKVTCANAVPVDCQTVPDPGQDFDGDGTPLCTAGVIDDCNDANPNIEPGNSELCNGFDDNCDGVLLDPDLDGIEDCLDCAPGDPDAWKVPTVQVTDLRVARVVAADVDLIWTSPPFACVGGTTFETMTSPTTDFTNASCSLGFGTSSSDSTPVPLADDIIYMMVRAANVCGAGPVAPDSNAQPRPVGCQ